MNNKLQNMPCDLYRFFDARGVLLYVGISRSFLTRLASHKAESIWYCMAVRIEIEKFDTRGLASAAEKKVIAEEKPLYNISHSVTIKKEKTEQYKCYSKISIYQVMIYLKAQTRRELCIILKCKNNYQYDKLEDKLTSRVFENMKQKMKKCKIKIPKEWNKR